MFTSSGPTWMCLGCNKGVILNMDLHAVCDTCLGVQHARDALSLSVSCPACKRLPSDERRCRFVLLSSTEAGPQPAGVHARNGVFEYLLKVQESAVTPPSEARSVASYPHPWLNAGGGPVQGNASHAQPSPSRGLQQELMNPIYSPASLPEHSEADLMTQDPPADNGERAAMSLLQVLPELIMKAAEATFLGPDEIYSRTEAGAPVGGRGLEVSQGHAQGARDKPI